MRSKFMYVQKVKIEQRKRRRRNEKNRSVPQQSNHLVFNQSCFMYGKCKKLILAKDRAREKAIVPVCKTRLGLTRLNIGLRGTDRFRIWSYTASERESENRPDFKKQKNNGAVFSRLFCFFAFVCLLRIAYYFAIQNWWMIAITNAKS